MLQMLFTDMRTSECLPQDEGLSNFVARLLRDSFSSDQGFALFHKPAC